MGYGFCETRIGVQFLAGRGSGSYLASCSVATGVVSQGAKTMRHEADPSPPSSAEVRNDGAIPPFVHISSWRGTSL
jgi:hypothetical protein